MRIFISHGQDKTVAAELKFVKDLARALETKDEFGSGHEVLLDKKRIDPGADWAGVLHDMLAECQAAILLLSPRAIERDWVLKEATVLAYRKAMDENFPIFPALIGGLKSEQLKGKSFSPLALGAIQALNGVDQPKAIAAAVKRELGKLDGDLPTTPLDGLARDLGAWIAKASNTAELEKVCEELYDDKVQWLPQQGRRAEQRARVIARGIVRERDPPPALLGQLIKRLHRSAGLDREAAEIVLTLASPLWVNPNAAAQLADVAGRNRASTDVPPRGISVALDSSLLHFTPDRYARRVLLPTTDAEVVCTIAGGGSDCLDRELPARVRAAYKRHMSLPADLPDAQVDKRMATTGKPLAEASAVFFLIPKPLPDADLLRTLQTTFPRVTFILQHDGRAQLPPWVQALSPPLDPSLELDMNDDDRAARNAIAGR